LTNLMTNAIKFTPEGGTVSLEASTSPKNEIVFKIQDTGIGMSAEEIPVALAPLWSNRKRAQPQKSGYRPWPAAHESSCRVARRRFDLQSKVGFGTVITLTFPPERTERLEKKEKQESQA
jgi:K+-sensing histidine kinase KdpD